MQIVRKRFRTHRLGAGMNTFDTLWITPQDIWKKTTSQQIYSSIVARLLGDIVCCGLMPTDQQIDQIDQTARIASELWESKVQR